MPAEPAFLDRPAATLSGGEATRVALAGGSPARPAPTSRSSTNPTNNLDSRTRRWLYDALEGWGGALIVVSHDRDLLGRVNALVDLDRRGAVSFGGGFEAYLAHKEQRQATAERQLRDAEARLERAKRQAQAELQREAQRNRSARKERAAGNVGKGAADFFQNRAELGSKAVAHQRAVQDAADAPPSPTTPPAPTMPSASRSPTPPSRGARTCSGSASVRRCFRSSARGASASPATTAPESRPCSPSSWARSLSQARWRSRPRLRRAVLSRCASEAAVVSKQRV